MTTNIIDEKLNFSSRAVSHSDPLYLKVQPINNLTSFNLSSTSVYGPVEFIIPSKCISLNESRLSWDYAGDYSSGATGYNWSSANNWNQLNRMC